MARTNQKCDTHPEERCGWKRAPAIGSTFEGLLLCMVALYMVGTVALPLYRGALTDAQTRQHEAVVATLHRNAVAMAGAEARMPAQASAD
ncbi:MAG: hypothetical protein GZ089_12045 [Aromatoleum sp.]|nr:hypothetical protein [Aromatoleum sp.]